MIYSIYTEIPISDRELQQVIEMVIYDVKSIVENKLYDYTDIRSDKLILFSKRLELLFNPYINSEIIIKDLDNIDKKDLFTLPIKCLLRIYDSIDFWHNTYGINGYYRMIEEMVLHTYCIGKYPYALEERFLED